MLARRDRSPEAPSSLLARSAILGALAIASCATLRDGPLLDQEGGADDVPRSADDGGDEDGKRPLAEAGVAAPEYDREWAMWRLPPPAPGANNYAVADGVVRDETTRLEWMQQATQALSHEEAAEVCASSTLAGGGFRLPTRVELLSLIDYTPGGVGINAAVFDVEPGTVELWASTPDALAPTSRAWLIVLPSGESRTDVRTEKKSVRCVRGPST